MLDSDYGRYFGAAIGFDLCSTLPPAGVQAEKFTLGTCPFNPNVTAQLIGSSFTIDGPVVPVGSLRVTFKEAGRDESTYVDAVVGGNDAPFSAATVGYDTSAPAINIANVESVHFMIATNETGPTPFDFCISNLIADY